MSSSFGVAVFAYRAPFFSKPGGGHFSGFFVGKFFFFFLTTFFFVAGFLTTGFLTTGFLTTLAFVDVGLGDGFGVAADACAGTKRQAATNRAKSFFIYLTT